jgi:hypothetical protein
MLGFGRHVFAALPITDGLIYQLDATDAANIAYDGSNNITSWKIGTVTYFRLGK